MVALFLAVTLAAPSWRVRLETSRGAVVVEVDPSWAPRAAARFQELVRGRYYDDTRFFRVVKGRWAQFGINGDPRVSGKWREATFPDEEGPARSNLRGTVAFAFAVPGGRSTQVFVNLADNQRLDAQGFAPFGRVVEGMENVDALYSGYGEESGGGIRGGKQQPLFDGGNAWLDAHFPRLDRLLRATIVPIGR
jgi:cyclophilin family peptidyl-prolyl cis-trans isomerase